MPKIKWYHLVDGKKEEKKRDDTCSFFISARSVRPLLTDFLDHSTSGSWTNGFNTLSNVSFSFLSTLNVASQHFLNEPSIPVGPMASIIL